MRYIFFSLCLLYSSLAYASHLMFIPSAETSRQIKQKFRLNNSWIVLLDDNTFWETDNPPFEMQTWKEWWNNMPHPQPDKRYYFLMQQWKDPVIHLYRYTWDPTCLYDIFKPHPFEEYLKDKPEKLVRFSYAFENAQTGECVLARPLDVQELPFLIIEYGKEQYQRGYSAGYNAGCASKLN